MSGVSDERLRKVRALLAKAEETTFEEEATAYSEKAAALIAKWELDEAVLWEQADASQRGRPTARTIEVHSPYATRKGVLLGAVATTHGCQVVRTDDEGGVQNYSVIGFAHDIDIVELLFSSLLVQMTTAMLADGGSRIGRSASATAAWRRSFIVGYAARVGTRLQAVRDAEMARRDAAQRGADNAEGTVGSPGRSGATGGEGASGPASRSVALVMQDRSDEVRDEMRRRFPRLRSSYVSAGSAPEGASAGSAAGERADIGSSKLGGRRRELRR